MICGVLALKENLPSNAQKRRLLGETVLEIQCPESRELYLIHISSGI